MEPDHQSQGPQGPQPEGPQPPPMATAVSYQPPFQPPPPRPRRAGRWLLLLLVLGLCGSMLANVMLVGVAGLAGIASLETDRKVREKVISEKTRGDSKVAVISLEGTILSGRGFIKRQIDHAKEDKDVKAVVLRVDSPGGTISGSDSIYHQLRDLAKERKIPIVVSMGGLAASGGYYASMACGHDGVIFAEPTTWTGSIGVIIPHYNLSELLTEHGIQEDSIVSHPLKQTGSFTKAMTDQEREIMQTLVDEGFTLFKDVIKKGRAAFDDDPRKLDQLATGQIHTAKQAKENGLIDRIGFLEDAVAKAIEMTKLEEDEVVVVQYQREPNLADVLLGAKAENQPFDLAAMLDMTAPRAYFMYTWLPPLFSSTKSVRPN